MIARDDTEHSSGNIIHGQEQGPEQIEGVERDIDKQEGDPLLSRAVARWGS
ncbi:hypothetical protein GQ55_9G039700 [Panicum hallii var. hallii]|uniref:Uncharacterized protein n=1 Tax=Panicum hallii var. hallii TaxID=1504633 RepID=A0A2T7BZN9_9POAL|nr:hypothetical protein GQ55_9G039700 [Panicum hallii var. hallii]